MYSDAPMRTLSIIAPKNPVWKSLLEEIFRNIWNYFNHPEAKYDGDKGILEHQHIIASSIVHIGKESNNLDISEVIGVQEGDQVTYLSKENDFLGAIQGYDSRGFD